jgi:hypothetical protein
MNSDIVFVLGMHRSGTSLLTRGLQAVGIELGENLLPPVPGDNDKGYFEDQRLHDLDNELLEQLGRTWCSLHLPPERITSTPELEEAGREFLRSKAAEGVPFGLKDPRLCLLLPWWLERCAELELKPGYVLALRHPLSVAKSVCKPGTARGDVAVVKALWLWYLHLVCALQNSENGPRVVVDYDMMVDEPLVQLQRIQRALGFPQVEPDQAFLDSFLDRGLRHSSHTMDDLLDHPDVGPQLVALYEMLARLSRDDLASDAREVGAMRTRSMEYLADLGPLLSYTSRQDEILASIRWEMQKVTSEKLYLENLAADFAELRKRYHEEQRQTQAEIHALNDRLAASRSELQSTQNELQSTQNELQAAHAQLADTQAQLQAVQTHLDAVLNSRSWRVTAPLRKLSSRVKKP